MPIKPPSYNRKQQAQRKASYERMRGTAQERGYTARWARYSKARLMEHPLCVLCLCEGKQVLATCTDHIKPAAAHPELFWDTDNHQSLCRSCNASKAKQDATLYGYICAE